MNEWENLSASKCVIFGDKYIMKSGILTAVADLQGGAHLLLLGYTWIKVTDSHLVPWGMYPMVVFNWSKMVTSICEESTHKDSGEAVRNQTPMSPSLCLTSIFHLNLLYKTVPRLQWESSPASQIGHTTICNLWSYWHESNYAKLRSPKETKTHKSDHKLN